ncbi:MAG: RluA family pseudouridine synthase [Pseudomonadota bacterium]
MIGGARHPYLPPGGPIAIHFLDKHLAVVEKPAGLLSVPGRGPEKADCLMLRLHAELPDALNVHRLDMETSGLIVVARDKQTQRRLSQAFENRDVTKTYEALVAGKMPDEQGTVELPLIADWPNRPRQKVDQSNGKPSFTAWQVVDRYGDSCRVLLHPKTGRSHQLRVHLDAIGHPILGDSLYGSDESRSAASRLMLHAVSLAFSHPHTGEEIRIKSATPF